MVKSLNLGLKVKVLGPLLQLGGSGGVTSSYSR